MVKNYGIHDEWKDLDKVNDIDIKSVDGVIDSIKVNGEEAGGGGGDFKNAVVKIVSNRSRASRAGFYDFVNNDDGKLIGSLIDNGVYYVSNNDLQEFEIPANGEKDFNIMIVKDNEIKLSFNAPAPNVSITGSGEVRSDDGVYCAITGDCTITIS